MRLGRFTLVVALLAAGPLQPVAPPAEAFGLGLRARRVAGDLAFPAAFTFTPDGRILYGERFTGAIRILDPTTGSVTEFFAVPDVATDGEQGLLGVALHPDFPSVPAAYAYATRLAGGRTVNQVLRMENGVMRVLLEADAAPIHDGGRILFGPDRSLYVVIGDTQDPARSQELGRREGKILRLADDGSVPLDNPIPGSPVFAYGFRNSFGFTFDPVTGRMWQTENGPTCNDELNDIRPGRNYGWGPTATCFLLFKEPRNTNQDGPEPVLPHLWFTPNIAPTGIAFCDGCGLGPLWEGSLLFGSYNTRDIRWVAMRPDRSGVMTPAIPVYVHSSGVLALETAPDGSLYFSDDTALYVLERR